MKEPSKDNSVRRSTNNQSNACGDRVTDINQQIVKPQGLKSIFKYTARSIFHRRIDISDIVFRVDDNQG